MGDVVMVPVADGMVPVEVTVTVGLVGEVVPVVVVAAPFVIMIGITGWLLLLNMFLNLRNFLRNRRPLEASLMPVLPATFPAAAAAAAEEEDTARCLS